MNPTPSFVPLVVNLPRARRARVLRSWAGLTIVPVVIFAVYLGLLAVLFGKLQRDLAHATGLFVAFIAVTTAVTTTLMYLPQVFIWPRRDVVVEVTERSVVVAHIDPWRRRRVEWAAGDVRRVHAFRGMLLLVGGTRREPRRLLVHKFLEPQQAAAGGTIAAARTAVAGRPGRRMTELPTARTPSTVDCPRYL